MPTATPRRLVRSQSTSSSPEFTGQAYFTDGPSKRRLRLHAWKGSHPGTAIVALEKVFFIACVAARIAECAGGNGLHPQRNGTSRSRFRASPVLEAGAG